MGAWRDRLQQAAVVFAAYLVISEVKRLYDDWRSAKAIQRMKELQARMHVARREDWREEELQAYDGRDPDRPILMAVDGRVFNVWRSRHLYGGGGSYQELAGRDATRLLAKQSLFAEEDDGAPLSERELENLQGWKEYFAQKYEDCGFLAAAS
mmetsp:Transcript_18468/g.57153  ORF Transcript_18468/g.57153 Transcript_18468/m.57153 type:complete len:153 (+) Transcript_18468:110-568(+)